jgi:hypothetical protein
MSGVSKFDVWGFFFSEVHKFFCRVSQIVSAFRELSGPGIKWPPIYVLHSGEMGTVLEAKVEVCAKKGFISKNVLLMKANFLWALHQGLHDFHWESERTWQHHMRTTSSPIRIFKISLLPLSWVVCHLRITKVLFVIL